MTQADLLHEARRHVIIALAGPAAARRARRLSGRERIAYHEAGHATVATVLGARVFRATVIPEQVVFRGRTATIGGEVVLAKPGQSAVAPRNGEVLTDYRRAVLMYRLANAAEEFDWRACAGYLRARRRDAEAFLSDHWPAVEAVAQELLRREVLEHAEVEAVLARFGSRSDALRENPEAVGCRQEECLLLNLPRSSPPIRQTHVSGAST